jgi:hypothetical protein
MKDEINKLVNEMIKSKLVKKKDKEDMSWLLLSFATDIFMDIKKVEEKYMGKSIWQKQ